MLHVGAVLGSVPTLAFVYTTSSREQDELLAMVQVSIAVES